MADTAGSPSPRLALPYLSAADPVGALLLAAAAWPHASGGERPPAGEIDATVLADAAERHGMLPVLHEYLAARGEPIPPVLRERRTRASYRYLAQTAALKRVLSALAAAGVDALVLKGQPLSFQIYGRPDLRPAVDIDLLIDPGQREAADSVLVALGFRPAYATPVALLPALMKDARYLAPGGIVLELHWRLLSNRFTLPWPFEALWAERVAVPLAGMDVFTLPPARQATYLALHGIHHAWDRLRWIADVAQLLREPEAMEAALEKAGSLAPVLLHAIHVAADTVSMPVADRHRRLWRTRRVAALDRAVCRYASAKSRRETAGATLPTWAGQRFAEQWVLLLSCGGRRAVLEEIRLLLVSAADRELVALPRGMTWLFPLLRPFLFLVRLVQRDHVWRRAR